MDQLLASKLHHTTEKSLGYYNNTEVLETDKGIIYCKVVYCTLLSIYLTVISSLVKE